MNPLLRALTALAVALCLTAHAADTAPVRLHVSPDGDNRWSGRPAAPTADGRDGPLATITAARDRIRELKAREGLTAPVTVLIREGVYHIAEPLVFTPQDSGTAAFPISYEAYPGERPVVHGGRVITDWRKDRDGLLVATVPGAFLQERGLRQLFVNGERRTLARTPNEGFYHLVGKGAPIVDPETGEETDASKTSFRFEPGHIKPWPNLNDINVVVYYHWETALLRIARVDTETNTVHFTGASKWPFTQQGGRQRYYVENVFEALDAPGEWYLDRSRGRLYYQPLPGEDPATLEAVAPVTRRFVVLAGDPDAGAFVRHLHFRGLSFRYADYDLPPEGHGDWQAAVTVPAVIHAHGARNCVIEGCEIAHIGAYGIWFERGCRNNRIVQNHLHDLGAGGVRLGMQGRAQTAQTETSHNLVQNNFIHNGGNVYAGAVGVWIGHASDNRVLNNEICDLNYTGISVGWSWGYGETGHHRNEIGFNHIHHIGRGVLSDMGGIYTLGVSPGTRIHGNLIHHVWCYAGGYGAGGIYPDEGSSEIVIENNVVYNTISGGLTVHYGKDITVRNNIFAFARDQQVVRGRPEEHTAFTFERNIVYYDSGQVWLARGPERNWEADENVYWHAHGEPLRFLGELTFEQWQAEGFDENSIVADPLFVAPRKYDFSLRRESPALELGFRAIDTGRAGLVGPREWIDLPRRIKRPPVRLDALPAPEPQLIDDGFEHTPVGATADFATTHGETAEATIRVTDERAASGARSLKFTDAPGLDQPWNPHMYYMPRLAEGLADLSFDLWLEPGAMVWHEWRDGATPFRVGPSLSVDAEGRLSAGDRALMTLPTGEWISFRIVCGLGRQATGRWDLTVTPSGAESRRFKGLPCNPDMKRLDWLGFVSNATDHAVFYLDNVRLRLGE